MPIVTGKPEEPKKSVCDYIANIRKKMADIHRTAYKNIGVNSDQGKPRQANAISFKEGEQVWL